jgi:hypothetical protein
MMKARIDNEHSQALLYKNYWLCSLHNFLFLREGGYCVKCDINFKYNKKAKYIEEFFIPLQEVNVTLMYSKLFY